MSATMHSARDTTRGDGAQTPLAKLWHGPATLGGSGRTAGGAYPSWFMRITCDRCGKVQMVNEARRT